MSDLIDTAIAVNLAKSESYKKYSITNNFIVTLKQQSISHLTGTTNQANNSSYLANHTFNIVKNTALLV